MNYLIIGEKSIQKRPSHYVVLKTREKKYLNCNGHIFVSSASIFKMLHYLFRIKRDNVIKNFSEPRIPPFFDRVRFFKTFESGSYCAIFCVNNLFTKLWNQHKYETILRISKNTGEPVNLKNQFFLYFWNGRIRNFSSSTFGAFSAIFYFLDSDQHLPCGSGSRRTPIMRTRIHITASKRYKI